jgi:peptidoglycan/LPS O-acetylase OafA/YrhL
MKPVPNSPIFRTYIGSNRATYLRAFAALGVLVIHYGGLGLRNIFPLDSVMGRALNNLVDFGGQGPTIFFVASGFVLQRLYQSQGKFWKFLLSRYFRLAPAYLLVSAFAIFTQSLSGQLSLSLVIKKVLFLDMFFEDAYAFNPIGIGFFVVLEFWLTLVLGFYNCSKIRNNSNLLSVRQISFTIASLLVSYFSVIIAQALNMELFRVDYLKYQAFFIIGALTYDFRNQYHTPLCKLRLVLIPLLFSVLFFENYLGYLAALISVVTLLSENTKVSSRPKWPLIAVGNICYSIYLLHIPLLRALQLNDIKIDQKIVAAMVLFVSTITYLVIEVPFIRLGKELLRIR